MSINAIIIHSVLGMCGWWMTDELVESMTVLLLIIFMFHVLLRPELFTDRDCPCFTLCHCI